MRYGAANFSDLSGPTNPTGILSPSFLFLKQALDRGDSPEKVVEALVAWLENRTQRGYKVNELYKLLEKKPAEALQELLRLVGGGVSQFKGPAVDFKAETLPPVVMDTLKRTLTYIAGLRVAEIDQQMAAAQQQRGSIRSKFPESAEQVVVALLD